MPARKTIKRALLLEVPFAEKDEAKNLGAWWDPDLRKWFVPEGTDPALFAKWAPKKPGNSQTDSAF